MVEGNVRLEWHDRLWILTSIIFNEDALGSTYFVLFHYYSTMFGCNVNSTRWSSRINDYQRQDLGLVPINNLERLRKYIFDIEKVKLDRVSNPKVCCNWWNYFDYKEVYRRGINWIVRMILRRKERNSQKVCCCRSGRLKITEVMSKPNDSKISDSKTRKHHFQLLSQSSGLDHNKKWK